MEASEKTATKPQKSREPWEKYGKYRYIYKLLHRLESEMNARFDQVEAKLNMITAGLSDWLTPEKDYLVSVVCRDEVDEALLWCLYSAGGEGISPTHIVEDPELSRFKLKKWHVTRRVLRMNERLKKKLGNRVAEKRGRKWAMTSFVHNIWGVTKEEIKAEKENQGKII